MSSPGKEYLLPLPWLLCFQFFVSEQIARLDVRGPYSMVHNAISDLGAIYPFGVTGRPAASISPLHALMNASFMLQGLLIVFGAILVRRLFPAGALAQGALVLFLLSGATLCVIGLAPEDVAGQVHVLAAAVHFASGALAMLLLGVPLLRRERLAGSLTLAGGALALAATLLLGFRDTAAWSSLGWGVGAIERVAAYPLPLWLTVTGYALVVRQHRQAKSETQESCQG